jgi:mannose-1-phosphate guanylyltransferase
MFLSSLGSRLPTAPTSPIEDTGSPVRDSRGTGVASLLDSVLTGAHDPWAILLAGGDGERLRPLTERIAGDGRPKQFCAVLEGDTLLERTRRRVTLAVRPDRQVVIVTRHHAHYYGDLALTMLPGRLVVQPANRGTAPAILYAVLTVRNLAGDVPVAVFPTDHEVADDRAFMRHVQHAIEAARRFPEHVVLLGIQPSRPEPEYGWIEPAREAGAVNGTAVHRIHRFREKPSPGLARRLFRRGGLWNSFVMVGFVSGFIELFTSAVPGLSARFASLARALGGPRESPVSETVYANAPTLGFSEQVLVRRPDRLLTLPVADTGWGDLGSPDRVLACLRRTGRQPDWLAETELAEGT